MTEPETRAAIVAEARSFIGTPYHHTGKVKGAGVDCMTLIVAVAEAVGVLHDFAPPKYGPQYGAHRSEETYLLGIMRFCREVETPLPGDIAIWKAGRTYSHAGIVMDWPRIIHAHAALGVIEDDVRQSAWFHDRPFKAFSLW